MLGLNLLEGPVQVVASLPAILKRRLFQHHIAGFRPFEIGNYPGFRVNYLDFPGFCYQNRSTRASTDAAGRAFGNGTKGGCAAKRLRLSSLRCGIEPGCGLLKTDPYGSCNQNQTCSHSVRATFSYRGFEIPSFVVRKSAVTRELFSRAMWCFL